MIAGDNARQTAPKYLPSTSFKYETQYHKGVSQKRENCEFINPLRENYLRKFVEREKAQVVALFFQTPPTNWSLNRGKKPMIYQTCRETDGGEKREKKEKKR